MLLNFITAGGSFVVNESSQRAVIHTLKVAKRDGVVNGKLNGYTAIDSPIPHGYWVTKGGHTPQRCRPFYDACDKWEID